MEEEEEEEEEGPGPSQSHTRRRGGCVSTSSNLMAACMRGYATPPSLVALATLKRKLTR